MDTLKKSPHKDNWLRCVNCGHKLGKIIRAEEGKGSLVEIKCHSCKTINLCNIKLSLEV